MTVPTTRTDTSLIAIGGWAFLATAFVGRLPSAMVQLGYLMILSQGGRGLAVGGLAVAAVGLGSAIMGPILGRLVDRFGPLPVLSLALALSLLGQACFIIGFTHGSSNALLLAFAGLVGMANPQIGPVARSHWSHIAERRELPTLVPRALGYEGAMDEISFIIGPMLSGFLVSSFGATGAALVIGGLTCALMGIFLAYLGATRAEWAAHRHARHQITHAPARFSLPMLWPMVACFGIGIIFGSTQTGLTSMFSLRGTPGYAGLIYGAIGIGSGVSSIAVGRIAHRISVQARVAGGGVLLIASGFCFMALPAVGLSFVIAIVLGAGAGFGLVSAFGWMERIAPRQLMATMMTLLATCITLGVSLGAAVAGRIAGVPSHAFWLVVAAGVLCIVAAVGMFTTRAAVAA